MDITIQRENAQPLLHRKDYTVRVFEKGATPSRAALVAVLAKKLGAKSELLVVQRISQAFGDTASIVMVSVYENESALATFESAYMKKRHEKPAKEAQAPADDAPKEAAKEEPPAPKEEKPAEAPEPAKEGDAA